MPADVHGSPTPPAPDLSALESLESDLAAVDRALAALDAGTYGRCQVCQAVIEADVMASWPVAARCGAHRDQEPVAGIEPDGPQDPGSDASGSQSGAWS